MQVNVSACKDGCYGLSTCYIYVIACCVFVMKGTGYGMTAMSKLRHHLCYVNNCPLHALMARYWSVYTPHLHRTAPVNCFVYGKLCHACFCLDS